MNGLSNPKVEFNKNMPGGVSKFEYYPIRQNGEAPYPYRHIKVAGGNNVYMLSAGQITGLKCECSYMSLNNLKEFRDALSSYIEHEEARHGKV